MNKLEQALEIINKYNPTIKRWKQIEEDCYCFKESIFCKVRDELFNHNISLPWGYIDKDFYYKVPTNEQIIKAIEDTLDGKVLSEKSFEDLYLNGFVTGYNHL